MRYCYIVTTNIFIFFFMIMNIIIVIITDYFSLHFVTKFHSYILLLKLPSDALYFFSQKTLNPIVG